MSFHADRDQVARWLDQLESLPPDRLGAVIRMLGEVVAACPGCGEPVTRTDPRRLLGEDEDRRLFHVARAAPGRGGTVGRG